MSNSLYNGSNLNNHNHLVGGTVPYTTTTTTIPSLTMPYDANGGYFVNTNPQLKYIYKNTYITFYKTKSFHIVCDLQPFKFMDVEGYRLKSIQFHDEKKAVSILFEKKDSFITVKTSVKDDELLIKFKMSDDSRAEDIIMEDLEKFKISFVEIVEQNAMNCSSCLHGSMYTINAKCDKNYDKLLVDITDEE